jgi:hypothetical protein
MMAIMMNVILLSIALASLLKAMVLLINALAVLLNSLWPPFS